jgi:septal ring factor EnvC (AmiA/AmiB activator)
VNYFPYLAQVLAFLVTSECCDSLLLFVVMNFPDFEALLRMYPASKIDEYQKAYALKASLLRKIPSERLVEQEEAAKKLTRESKKLKRDFNLAQAVNLNLEKKVAELADALKKCPDEKKDRRRWKEGCQRSPREC